MKQSNVKDENTVTSVYKDAVESVKARKEEAEKLRLAAEE